MNLGTTYLGRKAFFLIIRKHYKKKLLKRILNITYHTVLLYCLLPYYYTRELKQLNAGNHYSCKKCTQVLFTYDLNSSQVSMTLGDDATCGKS